MTAVGIRNAFVPAIVLAAGVLAAGAAGPARAQDNTCQWAFDGDCDEPGRGTGLCAPGTDTADCADPNPGPDSCRFAFDGECDHPGTGTGACPPGTDTTDCAAVEGGKGGEKGGESICQWANDGECDEPGIGTGLCAPGTDRADCESTGDTIIDSWPAEPEPELDPEGCVWAFDGECDEPGIGTGICEAGTDTTDCAR